MKNEFMKIYGNDHGIPRFKWQGSFHDHYIRDDRDFNNHLEYLKIQASKHGGNPVYCRVFNE